MNRDEALTFILETKVIAVIRMTDTEKLFRVTEAIRQGGVRAIEITMTVPNALSIIKSMAQKKSPDVLIGAGTVLDAETAVAAVQAGADFLVSPITNFDMIKACRKLDKFVAPGALTPPEIVAQLNQQVNKVLQSPEVRKRAEDYGTTIETMTPPQLADFTRSELDRWGRIIKAGGITAE